MADQDPFSGLRTGPWVGVNNDSVFKGLEDENTVVPGGVIEDQSITNAKIVNLNAEKIDAGTLKVTGSISIETSGLIPQLEITPTGTIMRNSLGSTVLEINGATTTFDANIISAGSITGSMIAANTITASDIAAGTITATEIAANTITAAKIAAGTITATEIAANTITAAKIAAGTITTTEIAANTITASDIAAGTITATEIATGTITADRMVAGTITAASAIIGDAAITGAKIASATITDANISSLSAAKLTAGAITIAPSSGVSAISSTNFNVTSTGSVTANDLTIGATTGDSIGNDTSGRIAIVPSTTQSAASLQVQTDSAGNLSTTKSVSSATSALASADSTVTTTAAHGFVAGQFVSFSGTTGAAWNLITPALPIQIKATPTTTTFTVNHFLALPALTLGGTVTAYKRLNIVAPGGAFVYQSGTTPGLMGSGSLALGSSLTNLGRGTTATLADGEMGFLTQLDSSSAAKTPRYGSGGSLYSRTGSTDVSTSGDFILGTSNTSTQGDIRFKTGTGGRIGAFNATSGNTSIGVYNADRSAYAALVALGFYPNQGTANLSHNGSNFTMNDTLAVTGAITATTNITATGTIGGSNLPSYVRTAVSTASTTSIAAQGFQDHTVTYTSTGSTPTVVIATVYHSGATSANLVATVWSRTASSATIRIYNAGTASTTSSRQAMVMVGIG